MQTLHLVLGGAAFGSVTTVVSQMAGHRAVALEETLSIGPLTSLDTSQGVASRRSWISSLFEVIHARDVFKGLTQDIGLPILDQLKLDCEDFVIWFGPNADEQLLLQMVAAKLSGCSIRAVDVTSVRSETFRPRTVAQCSPDLLRRAFVTAYTLSPGDLRTYAADWQESMCQDDTLRLYIDGAIFEAPEDYFDEALVQMTPREFSSAARVVGAMLGDSPHLIGDAFIDYRLRQLAEAGVIEADDLRQDLRSMRVREQH